METRVSKRDRSRVRLKVGFGPQTEKTCVWCKGQFMSSRGAFLQKHSSFRLGGIPRCEVFHMGE